MYKDVISYELAEGKSKEHLLEVAKEVYSSWMKDQVGFIKWEIHSNKDGSLTDIVYWKSKEDADRSTADMKNIPNAGDWYACYKEGSIQSKNLSLIAKF